MENNINSISDAEIIKKLEERLNSLEKQLSARNEPVEVPRGNALNVPGRDDELEMRIGQYWFPKLGIFVFTVGILFFLTLPFHGIPAVIPSLIGYAIALIILAVAHFSGENLSELKTYLIGGSAVTAFLSTLRLYFFGPEKVFDSWALELPALIFVVATSLWYAIKKDSPYLASLGIFLAYFTTLTIGNTYFLLIGILVSCLVSVRIAVLKNWEGVLLFSIITAFLTHAVWFISNPFFEGSPDSVNRPEINLVFLISYITLFSAGILKRKENSTEDFTAILSSLLNAAFGYGLFLIITLLNPSETFAWFHLFAAAVYMAIAVVFWTKEKSQYSTFIYAMTGYAALSVSIIYQFDQPWNLIMLCWQSILVISTAVWFRSRFIILANFIIFMMVLFAYLFHHWTLEAEAISFGLAALISARILNWQRDRLELKTEMLRNGYLLVALFWIPYLFHCVFSAVYASLSLLALALIYFAFGKLLKNLKYRWMAVLTLILTVIYLMVFGITNPDIYYKIISFIAAGIVLIITSAAYNRISKTVKKSGE